MIRNFLLALFAVGAISVVPQKASAIVVDLSFSSTGFVDIVGTAAPPYNSVSGSFVATFDPTQTIVNDTADLVVKNFSGVPVSSALGFSYFVPSHFLFFGGLQTGPNLLAIGTSDFSIAFDLTDPNMPRLVTCADPGEQCAKATGNAGVIASGYTVTGSGSAFFQLASMTVIGTPEPGTLSVLGAGLLGLMFWSRRNRRDA